MNIRSDIEQDCPGGGQMNIRSDIEQDCPGGGQMTGPQPAAGQSAAEAGTTPGAAQARAR